MDSVMDKVWSVIGQLLTPEIVIAIVVTLSVTHAVKIIAEHWMKGFTETAAGWRAFCTVTSIASGTLAGAAAFFAGAAWYAIPVVAFGSGPIWSLVRVALPSKFEAALLTTTDRKYKRKT